jgi:osmotically inducible protein OsmC
VPRIARTAEVAWHGSLSRGTGTATASTSGAFELPVDLPARVADPGGKTSPEELLAAAHATCYATSLAGELAKAGGTVEQIVTRCTVTMDEVEGRGHQIVLSELDVQATATGLDESGFAAAVEAADQGCPFSTLLRAGASVSVTAQLSA